MRRGILAALLLLLPASSWAQDGSFIRYHPPGGTGSGSGDCDPAQFSSPGGDIVVGGIVGACTLDVDSSTISHFSSGTATVPATGTLGDSHFETDALLFSVYPATDTAITLISRSDTATTGFGFVIDEDSFASDSATKVPTQQSVKAYVDASGGGGPTVVMKKADESITNDNTLSDDNTLTFSVSANTNYKVRGAVYYVAGTAEDFQYQLTCPASPDAVIYSRSARAVAATAYTVATTTACSTVHQALTASAGDGFFMFDLWFDNAANAGAITVQWSQVTSGGTTTTVKAGSFIEYTVVP